MEDLESLMSPEPLPNGSVEREQQICLFMLSQFVKGRKLEALESVVKNALDASMLDDTRLYHFGEASVGHARVGCQKDDCGIEADCIFLALPEEDPCVYLPSKEYIVSLGCLSMKDRVDPFNMRPDD